MKYRWRCGLATFSLWMMSLSTIEGTIIGDGNYFSVDVKNGYRVDNLVWSIQGTDGIPNIISELQFKDIEIYQLGLEARVILSNNIYVRSNIDYGWILDGKDQDSDYLGSNRTLEYSRSYAKIEDDFVFDFTLGIGYLFDICDTGLTIAPMLGYTHNEQHFRMTNGFQVVDTFFPERIGPILGLNSTYRTEWDSVWLGLDAGYLLHCDLFVYGNYEFHWANYHALGNWNLRDDFIGDFHHHANGGTGNVGVLGTKYAFCDGWTVGIEGEYQRWKTIHGFDRTNIQVSGDVVFPAGTRLNPVTWRTWSISGNIGYLF